MDELEKLLDTYRAGLEAVKAVSEKDVRKQVRQRKNLAKKLRLAQRLVRIFDELKFVPEQRKTALAKWGCVIQGQETSGATLATIIRFELKHTPYVLTFRELPANQEAVSAYLDLADAAGLLVFSTHLKFDVDESDRQWIPVEIDAFVPGDWVMDVLGFSLDVAAEEQERQPEPAGREVDDLKKKFGLA